MCWDCDDFEGAASHEIGHLLGIAHPDKTGGADGLAQGYVATNGTFYNTFLAGGGQMNETHCEFPWNSVAAGTPPDFPADELTGSNGPLVRPSIMESFTQHNPATCLFQDDYEALITLYPVCNGMPPTPRCDKADRNIGALRVGIFLVGPLLVALFLSILLHVFVERQIKHREKLKALRKQKLGQGDLGELSMGQSSTNIMSEAAMHQDMKKKPSKKSASVAPSVQPQKAGSSQSEDEAAAATKIAAMQRGKQARRAQEPKVAL